MIVGEEISPLEGVRAHDLRHVVVQLEDFKRSEPFGALVPQPVKSPVLIMGKFVA